MRTAFPHMRGLAALAAIVAAIFLWPGVNFVRTAKAAELVMFDSRACTVCRQFNAEIGDKGYAARDAARVLPLRRIDIDNGAVDITLSQPVTMTPTFVFVQDGAEIARFYGYPGKKHFFTIVDAAAQEIEKIRARETKTN